jgi:hypothetical protein
MPEPEPKRVWVCIADIESLKHRVVPMPPPVDHRWKVGIPGSGAAIEIAEPVLERIDLFVFGANNHLILEGEVPEGQALPPLGICEGCKRGEWSWFDPMQFKWALEEGRLYVRFDYGWLRIGSHAIRASWDQTDFEEGAPREVSPGPLRQTRPWWRRLLGGAG